MRFIKITPTVSIALNSVAQFMVEPAPAYREQNAFSLSAIEAGNNNGIDLVTGPMELCVALHERILDWASNKNSDGNEGLFDVRAELAVIVENHKCDCPACSGRDSEGKGALVVNGLVSEDPPTLLSMVFDGIFRDNYNIVVIKSTEDGAEGGMAPITLDQIRELEAAADAALAGERDTVLRFTGEDSSEIIITLYRSGANPACGIIEVVGDNNFELDLPEGWIVAISGWTVQVKEHFENAEA